MKASIVALLKAQVSAVALTYRGAAAPFDVVQWYTPANMQKDYLQNGKVQVLFSVKRSNSAASRRLANTRIPHADRVDYEVAVWVLDSPAYGRSEKDTLRDAAVAELKRIFKAYPAYGTERSSRDDDHAKGNQWILCTVVTVQKLSES